MADREAVRAFVAALRASGVWDKIDWLTTPDGQIVLRRDGQDVVWDDE